MKIETFHIIKKRKRDYFTLWCIYENGFTESCAKAKSIVELVEKIIEKDTTAKTFLLTNYNNSTETIELKVK